MAPAERRRLVVLANLAMALRVGRHAAGGNAFWVDGFWVAGFWRDDVWVE